MDETTPLTGGDRRVLAGRYALRGLLGQGGMADVELAFDQVLDRRVAVKILHARYADDPAFVARFRREAQAVASLNHPNIVGVYDTGQEDGRPFIVMEYVAGRSLREILNHEGVLPERAAEIAGDAALALHYAHERGLVHRDIKPGNIMVSDEGQVKVTDFGIARAVNAETVTQTAAVFGTAAYIAPEQAQGEAVDRRTDVYALGCVLYEMLTGRQPFAADSPVALAYQHVSAEPTPPRQINPDISPELEAVVMKTMAKDPASRYQSAQDLNADLQRALAGRDVTAPPAAAAAYQSTQVVERDRTLVAPPPVVPRDEERVIVADERPGNRAVGYVILALLVLAALVIAALLFANLSDEEAPPQVQVPDVRGRPVAEAENVLRQNGFQPLVGERVESDRYPQDTVVDTDPLPLSQAEQGSVVTLTVSQGPPLVAVPSLRGRSLQDAQAALREAGLGLGPTSQQASDDVPDGQVIGSNPAEGTEVPENTPVSLIVSSGPPPVTVPNVTNLPEDDAVARLRGFCGSPPCLRTQSITQHDDTTAEGRVIRTDPAAGTNVERGSTVTLVVSQGPEAAPPPPPPPQPSPRRSPRSSPSPTESPSPTPSPSA
ncbi:MAG: Stk1 family PASTA domain-containing Ser/Thr kinase [Actinomycetota bacterium]|nr:Stk1 family PASTA domain-containing Ser/Thr kinase [Actinomycetota bacterium]